MYQGVQVYNVEEKIPQFKVTTHRVTQKYSINYSVCNFRTHKLKRHDAAQLITIHKL
jgi:hypothetical protein